MLSDDRPHIGQRIRRARKAAGLTQQQFAPMIGLNQPTLSRLELSRNPRDFTISRVADALGYHSRIETLAHRQAINCARLARSSIYSPGRASDRPRYTRGSILLPPALASHPRRRA